MAVPATKPCGSVCGASIVMKEKYVEIDMENAQSKLLLCKYPESHGLLMYIQDREALLEKVISAVGCTRKIAKQLFTWLMFGGKVNNGKRTSIFPDNSRVFATSSSANYKPSRNFSWLNPTTSNTSK